MPLALTRVGVADASIGLVLGAAALPQIPAAIAGGRLVDAFGGARLFTAGGMAYLAATGVLLLPGVDVTGSLVPFVAARLLQGSASASRCRRRCRSSPPRPAPAELQPRLRRVRQNLTWSSCPPLFMRSSTQLATASRPRSSRSCWPAWCWGSGCPPAGLTDAGAAARRLFGMRTAGVDIPILVP